MNDKINVHAKSSDKTFGTKVDSVESFDTSFQIGF